MPFDEVTLLLDFQYRFSTCFSFLISLYWFLLSNFCRVAFDDYQHMHRYRFSHAAHNTENGSTVQRKKRRKARDSHAYFATFSRFTHSGALRARYAVAPAWQSDQAVGTKPTPYLIAISQSQYHNARKTRQLRGIGQHRDTETDRNAYQRHCHGSDPVTDRQREFACADQRKHLVDRSGKR